MIKRKSYFIVLFVLISTFNLYAQADSIGYLPEKKDTILTDIRFYGGITHQHQIFFNKAFSFQGLETGITINHKYIVGIYGSSYISNLKVQQGQNFLYYFISQAGIVLGYEQYVTKLIDVGALLNAGYLSVIGDNSNFPLFSVSK
jgi:hypothetical protein